MSIWCGYTQNQKLRKRFKGKPEYVMNFMLFIARELREIMAELGYRTIDEMVQVIRIIVEVDEDANMDYSNILMQPTIFTISQRIHLTLDLKKLWI